MKLSTEQWVSMARILLVAVLAIAGVLGYDIAIIQPREIVVQEETLAIARLLDTDNLMLAGGRSHFTELEADTVKAAAPTAIGTATPAMMADSLGVSNLFEVRDAATPVWYIADGGAVTQVGAQAITGDLSVTGDAVITGQGYVNAPTAVATATPAFMVNSAGVSNLLEIRDGGSAVAQIADGGNWTIAGDIGQTGDLVVTGQGYVAAPTAVATATPAFMVNSIGVSNLFEVRDAATPVFTVADGGNITASGTIAMGENSIDADELAAMTDLVYFCGQQGNNTTTYFTPVLAFMTGDFSAAYVMGDAQCDALDGTTEATEDEPIGYANTSFKVLGMMCEASGSGSNGVTFTLRSAAADLTPSMTCTIATGETSCTSVASSTTDVAAGATVAMKNVTTEDLSAQDGWCKVLISYK